MALPVQFQSFKAAGIYRLIYDKSTIMGEDTGILRLVVGYSDKGPFNTPVYVSSVSEFKSLFGNGSKSLEKRGCFFHRMAKQCLQKSGVLCLNLKKFENEKVEGLTINTNYDPEDATEEQITELKYYLSDIYDTTRFWELDAEKLNEISSVSDSGVYNKSSKNLTNYINIAATSTKTDSHTIVIRKASGSKVSSYNVTVSDWYKDSSDDIPEYLLKKLDAKISDFMAEIYVFSGEFTRSQILSSETLANYFNINEDGITLKPYVTNAYGDKIDTLDALYEDSSSGAVAHYVGTLIPYFKNKIGSYVDLSILFNQDVDTHHMMMSFNVDLLNDDENLTNIDLSCTNDSREAYYAWKSGKTSSLGNMNSPVNVVSYFKSTNEKGEQVLKTTNSYDDEVFGSSFGQITIIGDSAYKIKKEQSERYAEYRYVIVDPTIAEAVAKGDKVLPISAITGEFPMVKIFDICDSDQMLKTYGVENLSSDYKYIVFDSGIFITSKKSEFNDKTTEDWKNYRYANSFVKVCDYVTNNYDGGYTDGTDKLAEAVVALNGHYNGTGGDSIWQYIKPYCAVSIGSYLPSFKILDTITDSEYTFNSKFDITRFGTEQRTELLDEDIDLMIEVSKCVAPQNEESETLLFNLINAIADFNKSIAEAGKSIVKYINEINQIQTDEYNSVISDSSSVELAGVKTIDVSSGNDLFNNFVANIEALKEEQENAITELAPKTINKSGASFFVSVESSCNQEIGTLKPYYLEGYTYENGMPLNSDMKTCLEWQNLQLSALTDYKGLRTALLNKSDIDYRYIVDTFETYIDSEVKSVLSYLAKEKQSTFLLTNFPSIRTFMKCTFNSYTDSNNNFNVQYIVDGYNKKKAHSVKFCLPSEPNGAAYCAFYTPLKFSDGYLDTIVPSAAIVSNLFIDKYLTRNPYDIVAGPNFGLISETNLSGPDYLFTKEELNIIEPYGVNCMVYRPSFGTFINANQTAKQTPKSALSSVNVMELCIFIQDEIEDILQSMQWEFNNETNRQKVKDRADAVCQAAMNNGGIQDFINICDESNNTSDIIDNEMIVLSTHIEPGRGMGKMVQELTLYRTGQMRSAISS